MKKKILIIDDEKDFGLLLKGYFTGKKFDVSLSYTIEDGMKALEEIRPDYIFLDNNLPDGFGWGKTDYILNNYPNAQLNLISAYQVPKTNANNFRILEKPLSFDELNRIFD
jgi:DNA-binding NtrC family response regulator